MIRTARTLLFAAGLAAAAICAAEAGFKDFPNLPPTREVARLLNDAPAIRAALAQRDVENANRTRLETGPHEWNLRAGSQQRRVRPDNLPGERFSEWSAALERPLRLPGKAGLDAGIGSAGVALADTAIGDARHELSRFLLKLWFDWLRESESQSQWKQQVALLERQSLIVSRRQKLGDAAGIEAIQAEAALAQARAQLAQATSREQATLATLQQRFPDLQAPARTLLADPEALSGDVESWVARVLEHNHELALAEGERTRAGLLAERARRERLPDPSVGIAWSRERGGEENLVGAYISIPLPGGARSAAADAAGAQQVAAGHRAGAVRQKIAAEAAALFHSARAAVPAWQAARTAAQRLNESARLSERAYQLGEGNLSELLASRRLANEAELAARTQQIEALALRYQLLLDTHQLWPLD